ncbi:hypothetical protein E3J62_08910 [candidate division TA06 bacterium]|uniref:KOW domain-containing protein n=1 Tax=candidate division TA06 bacterium TaxID=2250710 RepID=A0A523URG6_UNCT6|nr:MAG: hypothetical protein E3J62_08910 [candidate division TA06 bacterium]
MAHAYTPGLKVAEADVVRKERRLPLKGEVIVSVGDTVNADQIVARTELPGNVQTINVAGRLGCVPADIVEFMLKSEGDTAKEGEPIAETKGFFGFLKTRIPAPCDCTIESISEITGQVILREPPIPVQVDAYVDGKIVDIYEGEGIAVETYAAFIQGIFGIGGETKGGIMKVSSSPDEVLTEKEVPEECAGRILIGGSMVTAGAVKEAIKRKAAGIVAGGMDDEDLKVFLGYELGVAITGSEDIGTTVIITEGFGKMRMADKTFNLLVSHEGQRASMNGATQIRAGVIRPEIVVPLHKEGKAVSSKESAEGLVIGSPIRVIREPYFGILGKVTGLPSELENIETEAKVRVLEVELADGRKALLPRANVEIIEG